MKTKKQIGTIKKLFISNKSDKKRESKESIEVDLQGILNDKFYDKDFNRAVLLTSLFAYDIMQKDNIEVQFGQLGENILVDFNPYELKKGTQLFIDDAILEITTECTICNLLKKIDDKVPALLKNDRGVFAKVIKNGHIKLNATIHIIN